MDLYLPKEWIKEKISFSCYSGTIFTKELNCSYYIDPQGYTRFSNLKPLAKRESIVGIMKLPKNLVPPISFKYKLFSFMKKYWYVVLLWIFLFYYLITTIIKYIKLT